MKFEIKFLSCATEPEIRSILQKRKYHRLDVHLGDLYCGMMPDPQPQIHALHRLHITDYKDVKVVSFIENKILDEANITEIGQALALLVEARHHPKLLLDFQNVDHLSSAALGMLINVNQQMKLQSGELRLVNIKPQIMEVFSITRLDKLFRILADRDSALSTFSPA